MTDEEWKAYLASDRCEASRSKHYEWRTREARKMQAKLEKRLDRFAARYRKDLQALSGMEAALRADFAQRTADHEKRLLAADFKALGLTPGRDA